MTWKYSLKKWISPRLFREVLCFHERIVVLFVRGFDRIWKGFWFNVEGKKKKLLQKDSLDTAELLFLFSLSDIFKINSTVIFNFFVLVLLQKHGERNKERAFSRSVCYLMSTFILHSFCLYLLCLCSWCMRKSGRQIFSWIAKVWYFMACSHRNVSL